MQAGNGPKKKRSSVVRQLSMNMNYPSFLSETKKEYMQVRVSFKITGANEKEILVVNGPTEELKKFVVETIKATDFSGNIEKNKEYNIVFNFRKG